jgi:hypothetical protein
MQHLCGSNEISRFKALREFLVDRGQQSRSLGPAVGRDPVRGKIGGAPQLEGHHPDGARLDKRLLQPLFGTHRLGAPSRNSITTADCGRRLDSVAV